MLGCCLVTCYVEMLKPDSYTISSMVSSCAKLASLYHGQVVHGKVVVMGIDNNMLIFETMPIQNVITWNAMILGYAQNGQVLEALTLYEKMQEKFKTDNITFVGVLSAWTEVF